MKQFVQEERMHSAPSNNETELWALKLFNKSPLKQRKLFKILAMLGESYKFENKTCLDIGSDNGVISYLLRKRGGTWHSADLIPETVESIKSLVHSNVHQIDGETLPFEDKQFDLVIIVDFLEHISTDRALISELHRTIKNDGTLVVNVPNPKEGFLRWLKNRIGQTDAAHGHLRPGYSLDQIKILVGDKFEIVTYHSYGRIFSEIFDTAMTFLLDIVKGRRGKKGTVVTANDMRSHKKSFKIYSMVAPLLFILVKLDDFIPFLHGNMLILNLRRR